jgi:hypothetical protein
LIKGQWLGKFGVAPGHFNEQAGDPQGLAARLCWPSHSSRVNGYRPITTLLVVHPHAKHEAWLLNHHTEMLDIMVATVHRITDARVSVMIMLVTIVFPVLQMTVNPLSFAIQVAIDLVSFFLEVVSLPILASRCGVISLAVKPLLDAITFGIQVPLDASTFG